MSDYDILYHYTSNANFIKILENETIRLSSLEAANDFQEGRWFSQKLRQFGLSVEPSTSKHAVETFFEAIGQIGKSFHIQELIRAIDKSLENTLAFSFCMSTEQDLLSQWRGYGENGEGVAIGFKKNTLRSIVYKNHFPYAAYLNVVKYDEEDQEAYLKDWATKFILGDKEVRTDIIKKFSSEIYFFKNPAFREEKEWRIIGVVEDEDRFPDTWNSIKLFDRAGHLVPYINFQIPDMAERLIEKIVLGPKNKTNIKHFKSWLKHNGLEHISVEKSSASYR